MNKRLISAGLAATGGLVTTAFLQVAVAAADAGADAFTIGGYTFDPQLAAGGEGFDPVYQLTTTPPLLELGGGTALGNPLAVQDFNVYSPDGTTELGSIQGNETVTELFGLTNAEFTVASVDPTGSATDANLPAVGSVYDVFNLGNGYENVYTAVPGGSVSDVLVTPTGKDIDLSSLFTFNAADPMNPGDAFTGLELGNITGAQDAISIAGYVLDPQLAAGGEGFDTIAPLATAAPFLEIGGSSLGDPATGGSLSSQAFEVLDSSGTDIGTINTGVDVTNLLGFTNTQLVVENTSDVGAGLPTQGTVLDTFNFGNGYENVYTATPGTDGTVTDTLVTPYGNVNLDSLFGGVNYANPLNPGDALTGLQAGDSAIGADAFTIGGVTFDPTLGTTAAEGFNPVEQLVGAPPFLDLGGGTPTLILFGTPIPLSLATQSFDIYDGTASTDQIGSIDTTENVTNLLGFSNAEFTVTGGSLLADAPAGSAIPVDGSVYDVLNLGNGFENIYTAIPGLDGAAAQISDILATPFGNVDLGDLFGGIDATALLNPGDAFDALTSGLTEALSGAAGSVDPLAFLGL